MTKFSRQSFMLSMLAFGALLHCQSEACAAEFIVPENTLGVDSWRSITPGQGHALPCGSTSYPNVYKVVHYLSLNPQNPPLLIMYRADGVKLVSMALRKPLVCNFSHFYREY